MSTENQIRRRQSYSFWDEIAFLLTIKSDPWFVKMREIHKLLNMYRLYGQNQRAMYSQESLEQYIKDKTNGN